MKKHYKVLRKDRDLSVNISFFGLYCPLSALSKTPRKSMKLRDKQISPIRAFERWERDSLVSREINDAFKEHIGVDIEGNKKQNEVKNQTMGLSSPTASRKRDELGQQSV